MRLNSHASRSLAITPREPKLGGPRVMVGHATVIGWPYGRMASPRVPTPREHLGSCHVLGLGIIPRMDSVAPACEECEHTFKHSDPSATAWTGRLC